MAPCRLAPPRWAATAKPGDIAAAVAYLAGPDAGFVTATTLTVDGGPSAA
jgi:NAD(P)-dependent dehydrogenase (short-subunit alcohol dehydrogenase family)